MTKMDVPPPGTADTSGQLSGAIPVSRLAVELRKAQTSILLGVWATGSNAEATTFALSPPAAARLARELQSAVDDYLYGADSSAETE